MKNYRLSLFLFSLLMWGCSQPQQQESATTEELEQATPQDQGPITLVIHGGAGTILRKNMTPERDAEYREKLTEALNTGYAVLEKGGTSLDAVIAAIQVMEASPLFNAGKGAVFTNEGKNELDASIMDGNTGKAGAVAGVTTVKSPIQAARSVMDSSPHVMMAGTGAEKFAKEQGLEMVDPDYFHTDRRFEQLQKIRESEDKRTGYLFEWPDRKFGTVGAVALDKDGNIAAGTSTGGMTNKRYGRIGDAPIIGAGTYADNATCGVSATGHGEFFIRNVVAYDIAALMKYTGITLNDAAEEVINKKLVEIGGGGGIVSLDRQGNVAMKFNTEGMYRGFINESGKPNTFIYKDE
ncbi:MAG: isoaspartyl peptidase/L-asparaginase [Cyclobacteriaceae bacterium]|nr:isoaspartyl peptidase/L-asparaginase [Cyclobacteriaceae bacterium]